MMASSLTEKRSCSPPSFKKGKWTVDDDHLSELPEEILCRVTSFLNAKSLYELHCVNPHYHSICLQRKAGWEYLCQYLWKTKVHHATIRQPSLSAYLLSIQDSHRQYLHLEELCYNAELHIGTIWSFRFKESAGSDWTHVDPWYNGEPCRKMVF